MWQGMVSLAKAVGNMVAGGGTGEYCVWVYRFEGRSASLLS
jgi:hypothetical protein